MNMIRKNWRQFYALLVLAMVIATPARAAEIIVTGSGTVTGITNIRGAPTGSVVVGSPLQFSFRFDPAAASVLFNGGPGFQVFGQPMSNINISIGGYSFAPFNDPGSLPVILIGSGFAQVAPGQPTVPVINQSFVMPGLPTGNGPFQWPSGSPGATFSLESRFLGDFGGRTPTLADLLDPANAQRNRFTLTVGDDRGAIGFVEGSFAANFASAVVPEPSTWAMMILGFGLIGGTIRRRRHRVVPQKPAIHPAIA